MLFELSPLIVWVALWIVNIRYSKFQVNIFSNNRGMTKCQFVWQRQCQSYSNNSSFFSENGQAEKGQPCSVKRILDASPKRYLNRSAYAVSWWYHFFLLNPLPDEKNFRLWSKLRQIADDILKCILNGKQVPCRVENIVRKGEIACYKQFLLFSQCFLQLYIFNASKCSIAW